MKNLVLLLTVTTLLTSQIKGQIETEIVSFVDSTEIIVNKGRKMILNEINSRNLKKTREIYNYLSDITREQYYAAFYFIEDLYINMLLGEWTTVNELMLNYNNYKGKRLYPDSYELNYRLFDIVKRNKDNILANSEMSDMPDEAKQLTEILLHYIETGYADDDYTRLLKQYRSNYKESDYNDYREQFMPKKYIKGSWSFSFGSGMIITTNKLAENFGSNGSGNMSMDINIDRVFTSLYFQGTSLKLKQPFSVVSEVDTLDFGLNEKFSFLDVGFKAGYFLVRSERFHIAPFVSASGTSLKSMRFDAEDDDLEYEICNAFTYGAGLHTEIRLTNYNTPNAYGTTTFGYVSLKLEGCYNKIARFKDEYAKGDTPYFIAALVFGLGEF